MDLQGAPEETRAPQPETKVGGEGRIYSPTDGGEPKSSGKEKLMTFFFDPAKWAKRWVDRNERRGLIEKGSTTYQSKESGIVYVKYSRKGEYVNDDEEQELFIRVKTFHGFDPHSEKPIAGTAPDISKYGGMKLFKFVFQLFKNPRGTFKAGKAVEKVIELETARERIMLQIQN